MKSKPTNPDAGASQTPFRIRSVDGTVYFITSRTTVDYVLHPEFLIFVTVNCVIYALL